MSPASERGKYIFWFSERVFQHGFSVLEMNAVIFFRL